jgi:hypothetical protein
MVERVVEKGEGRGRPSVTENVPIESLRENDLVVSYSAYSGKVLRRGRRIERIGVRSYQGNMHTIEVAGRRTRATADHRFTVRFNPEAADKHIVYLMRRGDWWRVGSVRVFNSRGFSLAVRLNDEKADAAWIVGVYDDHLAARVGEQAISCYYGIPTTHWETSKRPNLSSIRTKAHIAEIYAQVGLAFIGEGAQRLLKNRGLSLTDPIITREDIEPTSRRHTRLIRARNIVPSIMQLPVPTGGDDFEWSAVTSATHAEFDGQVYSMDVEQDQHYVADGIVTHNCFYASKAERSPKFYGEPGQTTVWRVEISSRGETAAVIGTGVALLDGRGHTLYLLPKTPKAKKVREIRITDERPKVRIADEAGTGTVWEIGRDRDYAHPTQKPVELARRAIENSSQRGDIVVDGFSGSFTTGIASEILGRRCFASELDPTYVDVGIKRWQEYTGQKATLDGGQEYADVAVARRTTRRGRSAA